MFWTPLKWYIWIYPTKTLENVFFPSLAYSGIIENRFDYFKIPKYSMTHYLIFLLETEKRLMLSQIMICTLSQTMLPLTFVLPKS